MSVTMWGNDMLINLTVGIISHTHIYIYVERDYKIMLYTLNAKHFIKECCIVIVNIICSKKKRNRLFKHAGEDNTVSCGIFVV